MSDNLNDALAEWVGSFMKTMGGALFNEALTLAETAKAEAESLTTAARVAALEGRHSNAVNALMTAAQRHLDSSSYFQRTAALAVMGRMQYQQSAVEQQKAAQKAIEILHALENRDLESRLDSGEQALSVDEAPSYPPLTPGVAPETIAQVPQVGDVYAKSISAEINFDENGTEVWNIELSGTYSKPVEKGDTPGHPFRGNQYTEASADLAQRVENGGGRMKWAAQADQHKGFADEHRAIARGLMGAVNRGEIKQGRLSAVHEAIGDHLDAADLHDKAAKEAQDLTWLDEGNGGRGTDKATDDYIRRLGDANRATDIAHEYTHLAFSLTPEELNKSTEIAKGDTPGHPFHGNQYSDGASAGITGETLGERARNLYTDSTGQTDLGNDMPVAMHMALAVDHRATASALNADGDSSGATLHSLAADAHETAANLADKAIAANDEHEGRGDWPNAEDTQEAWLDASDKAASASERAEKGPLAQSPNQSSDPRATVERLGRLHDALNYLSSTAHRGEDTASTDEHGWEVEKLIDLHQRNLEAGTSPDPSLVERTKVAESGPLIEALKNGGPTPDDIKTYRMNPDEVARFREAAKIYNGEKSRETDIPKGDAVAERRDYTTASDAANDAVSKLGDPSKTAEVSAIHSALALHHEAQWGQAKTAGDAEKAQAHKEASIAHSEASVFMTPEASQKAADLTAKTEMVAKGDVQGHEFHGNQWTDSSSLAARANELSDRWGLDDRKTDGDDHKALAKEHTRIGHDIYRVIHNGNNWEPFFKQKMTQIANAHLRAADAHRNAANAKHDAEMDNSQRQRATYRASDASEEARDLEKENASEFDSIKNRVAELPPELPSKTAGSIISAVMANGGATISQAGVAPKTGYIVATDPKLGVVLSGDFFRNTALCKEKLADYIMQNQADLASGTKYLGLWHETEDENNNPVDKVHLDIVEKIDNIDEATKAGQDRNQKSIWDVVNAKEILTGGSGSENQE